MIRPAHTTALLAAASLALATPTTHAQQGPAELWAWGGASSADAIVAFDETGDVSTGTIVATTPTFNIPEIEFIGDSFVLVQNNNGAVEVIDAVTGALTSTVAASYPGSAVGASAITGMEFVNGTLYAAGTQSGGGIGSEIGTLDPLTGVYTPIGVTGLSDPISGLAWDGNTMYAVNGGGGDGALYTIDLTTGAATFVIDLTGDSDEYAGLEFGADGVLYAVLNGDQDFGSIDIDTGVYTGIGNFSGLTGGSNAITSTFLVPEPTSLALLALGGLLVTRRRHR
ncbi:MAG: PEP-CTERM sorting domain-containing protein [Planctomycetota bacterium]